ncbi:MAG TPA: M48 family metalloprotease [Terracidiphilus sp.]|nr:M48 family metalloprotease [Terracidiphilus sp.]
MRTAWNSRGILCTGLRVGSLAGLALALSAGLGAQSTGTTTTPASTPAAQPAPGTTPVGGDAAAASPAQQSSPGTAKAGSSTPAAGSNTPAQTGSATSSTTPAAQPAPGTAPVGGDAPATKPAPGTTPIGGDTPATNNTSSVNPEKVVDPGSQMTKVKPGSIEDVSAVGNRDIGARGLGNWYSVDTEIKMGKMYAEEIEKSTKFINDPVVLEYVNRIGQNIVKNSDCKVPFTIKIIDSDEINAMALPGGFFYVNSGLILNADEEAELAGVMAHETAHVCAHHAVREQTRMNYAQLSTIPLIFIGGWTGYGIYEAASLAVPMTFLKFSRDFEAQADYLGVQYMYRAGYDPQAFISFFEKVQALEKRKPGMVAKAFSDHPQTPDRILHSQEEIARILPARDEYTVTTSEFDDVKARLARIENKRRLTDSKDTKKPSLRRASTDPNSTTNDPNSTDDGPPTLHRREDQN